MMMQSVAISRRDEEGVSIEYMFNWSLTIFPSLPSSLPSFLKFACLQSARW